MATILLTPEERARRDRESILAAWYVGGIGGGVSADTGVELYMADSGDGSEDNLLLEGGDLILLE